MSESELREIMDDENVTLDRREMWLVAAALSVRVKKCKAILAKGGGVSPGYWQAQLDDSIALHNRLVR